MEWCSRPSVPTQVNRPKLPLKGPSLKLKFISTCYRARLAPLNEALSGAWASCTLWLLILLPLLPGDRARDELTGGANWPCLGLGASEALFPRAPSACNLLGDSLVGVRSLSGFGGGGLSRSRNALFVSIPSNRGTNVMLSPSVFSPLTRMRISLSFKYFVP